MRGPLLLFAVAALCVAFAVTSRAVDTAATPPSHATEHDGHDADAAMHAVQQPTAASPQAPPVAPEDKNVPAAALPADHPPVAADADHECPHHKKLKEEAEAAAGKKHKCCCGEGGCGACPHCLKMQKDGVAAASDVECPCCEGHGHGDHAHDTHVAATAASAEKAADHHECPHHKEGEAKKHECGCGAGGCGSCPHCKGMKEGGVDAECPCGHGHATPAPAHHECPHHKKSAGEDCACSHGAGGHGDCPHCKGHGTAEHGECSHCKDCPHCSKKEGEAKKHECGCGAGCSSCPHCKGMKEGGVDTECPCGKGHGHAEGRECPHIAKMKAAKGDYFGFVSEKTAPVFDFIYQKTGMCPRTVMTVGVAVAAVAYFAFGR